MLAIYLNNFRGFRDIFVPLEQVTFLVGENSSGKTSFLTACKLIFQDFEFFNIDFNQEGLNLGSFKEIVDINSSDKNKFELGYIFSQKNEKNEDKTQFAHIEFQEDKDGNPKAEKLVFYDGDYLFRIKRHKTDPKKTLAKVEKIIFSKNQAKKLKSIASKDIDGAYDTIKGGVNELPLSFLLYLIRRDYLKEVPDKISGKIFTPYFESPIWTAPIRAKPNRFYEAFTSKYSPEGHHIPKLLKSSLAKTKNSKKLVKDIISIFGTNSGLFKDLQIKKLGKENDAPFSLNIQVRNGFFGYSNVGYGVSQSLPIVVDIEQSKKGSAHIIQQPEVHLHPKAQAAMGDIIFQSASNFKKSFIIETHSDYLIDRFRIAIKKSKNYVPSQILFFENSSDKISVTSIKITDSGSCINVPESYKRFFIKEQLDLLSI